MTAALSKYEAGFLERTPYFIRAQGGQVGRHYRVCAGMKR